MNRLGVNIDHVATLRQARMIDYPDPVEAALLSEKEGCHGITAHLREDRRHVQDEDIRRLRKMVKTRLNLELAFAKDVMQLALEIKPDQVTFVPEKREEITTEGGLDVRDTALLARLLQPFVDQGIKVSLFIDPDQEQLDASLALHVPCVELHTGAYAEAANEEKRQQELECLQKATAYGLSLGLQMNAGHGLHYDNVGAIVAIPGIDELNIGHSIVSRAVFVGIQQAVHEMLVAMGVLR